MKLIYTANGVDMAFKNIKGVRVKSNDDGQVFILADCFAVYENNSDTPTVYEWSDLININEVKSSITINTTEKTYKIHKKYFDSDTSYLTALAIIEGACADFSIAYTHSKRLIVSKDKYIDADLPKETFAASGFIDENEMASIYSSVRNSFITKMLFSFSVFICAIVFMLLYTKFTNEIRYIPLFLMISIMSGAIFAIIFFLVQHTISKGIILKMVKSDPVINFQITYAICKTGFVEIESFLFTKESYISWREADSYIDTNKAIVILKGNSMLMKLPKRLFTRDEVKEILELVDECINNNY